MPDDKSNRVDKLFAPWTSKNGMPGAAVAVIKEGEVVHLGCYGLADISRNVPVQPSTSFLLASLTKQFTAMAIMILADDNQCRYSDPLTTFFPQFPNVANTITVEHLLHHTSGIAKFEDVFLEEGWVDKDDVFPRSAMSTRSRREPTSKDTLESLSWQALRFPPGEKYEYSNSGYVILAQIVELISKKSFAEFIKKHIFDPAGMPSSDIPVDRWREFPNRATSYTSTEGQYRDIDYTPLNLIYGEDGIFTTIEDMVRWDRILDTEKLVKKATLVQAFSSGKLNDGSQTNYGYGWAVGPGYVDHDGAWLGFRTYIRRYLNPRFTVIVLANCAGLNAFRMGDNIARIYLGK
jgi:CubicO group peptidase (beta-lactamase class C family)